MFLSGEQYVNSKRKQTGVPRRRSRKVVQGGKAVPQAAIDTYIPGNCRGTFGETLVVKQSRHWLVGRFEFS